jgi:hypothetical protein
VLESSGEALDTLCPSGLSNSVQPVLRSSMPVGYFWDITIWGILENADVLWYSPFSRAQGHMKPRCEHPRRAGIGFEKRHRTFGTKCAVNTA